ncbi:DUF1330 domain-containing protein [Novosphingobium sp. Chol11]|uniref:DUF1330 domain-containing protein n=1 Tax=Novosphingobium sp. Chol11 TaxID=1385763 RepID=UPI0025DA67A4|nr:DUF1330 domain-containing protein [Novosphingobium sp. Chol11]
MAAYVVFIREGVTDQAEMDLYSAKAGPSTAGHPLTPLAFYGAHEAWEGAESQGLVILQFPDMDAAKAWYHSPAYQEAKVHRLAGANYRVLVTEGVG